MAFSACNWFKETPEIGLVLAKHFDNRLFKNFDTTEFNLVFEKHLDSLVDSFSNPNTLKAYYLKKNNQPGLVTNYFANGSLNTLRDYISKSKLHGIDPEVFHYEKLKLALEALSNNEFKSIAEVYPVVAKLELSAAESLIRYNNVISYGIVNPRTLFSRYYIPVSRPDSLKITAVLATNDLQKLLKDIQPASENYRQLQRAMLAEGQKPNPDAQALKILNVNLERLRWKLPDLGEEYVEVNIPDFSLTWFNNGDTLSHMKVCVGAVREDNYTEKYQVYRKSGDLDDKPKNHETPLLYSKLNGIQVNPIWNIPVSIARSEIYWQAARDPYYLSNNNIKVYYKGQRVADPDTIQWNKYPREKLPFQFKQGSGDGNALGKFKFIFDNGSSIYLHDTNNKSGFALRNRAISHGCVRVERPLEFAQNMVKDKYEYDRLRMEVNLPPLDTTKMEVFRKKLAKKADTVNLFKLKPKWFSTKKQIPLVINYYTAWPQNGVIQYRPDVYGLDESLYAAMKKFM